MKYAIVDLGSNTNPPFPLPDLSGRELPAPFLREGDRRHRGLHFRRGPLPRGDGTGRRGAAPVPGPPGEPGEERLYVFATASLRNIRNTGEAVEAIRRRAGVKVEVLSGEEEARMGYQGALLACGPDPAGAMFDIGGGSSEVLVARDGAVQKALSLPVGSLNLFNQYVSKLWPKRGNSPPSGGRSGRNSPPPASSPAGRRPGGSAEWEAPPGRCSKSPTPGTSGIPGSAP